VQHFHVVIVENIHEITANFDVIALHIFIKIFYMPILLLEAFIKSNLKHLDGDRINRKKYENAVESPSLIIEMNARFLLKAHFKYMQWLFRDLALLFYEISSDYLFLKTTYKH
ncbi:uncharacterized protein VICG_01200, partial [Vittaforma corneae ATCC 50505]